MAPLVFGRHKNKINKPFSAYASNLDLTTSTYKIFPETFSILERFLEIPFQAPNMLQFSGYKLLINENFNSPALIVKNTTIILLEFTTTSAFYIIYCIKFKYIHWCFKGWQFFCLSNSKRTNSEQLLLKLSLEKFKSGFEISNNPVIIPYGPNVCWDSLITNVVM